VPGLANKFYHNGTCLGGVKLRKWVRNR